MVPANIWLEEPSFCRQKHCDNDWTRNQKTGRKDDQAHAHPVEVLGVEGGEVGGSACLQDPSRCCSTTVATSWPPRLSLPSAASWRCCESSSTTSSSPSSATLASGRSPALLCASDLRFQIRASTEGQRTCQHEQGAVTLLQLLQQVLHCV